MDKRPNRTEKATFVRKIAMYMWTRPKPPVSCGNWFGLCCFQYSLTCIFGFCERLCSFNSIFVGRLADLRLSGSLFATFGSRSLRAELSLLRGGHISAAHLHLIQTHKKAFHICVCYHFTTSDSDDVQHSAIVQGHDAERNNSLKTAFLSRHVPV